MVEHEGLCLDLYRDTAFPPRWTIGIGRNLSDVGLRDETKALFLLGRNLDAIRAELDNAWPLWRHLDDVRRGERMFCSAGEAVAAGWRAPN